MSRFVRVAIVCALVLGVAGIALGEEGKEEKMTVDETQESYQRKSITYLGIVPKVAVPEEDIGIIEKAIRKGIELKRFDYNAVNLGKVYTIDQFVAELREYVKKRAVDRAAAEAEYEARFKSARVLASDVDRIMSSAYFYIINVVAYRVSPKTCPWDPVQAAAQKCTPGTAGMQAMVNATVTFWKADLGEGGKPPYYTLVKDLRHGPVKGFSAYESPPKPPPGSAPDNIVEQFQKLLAAYTARLPQLQHKARLSAVAEAAGGLSMWLSKGMKKIPAFQLKTPVQAALSDGVEFMLGKGEGVRLDDTYDVTEFDAAGKKKIIGYVKVRNIGEAKGTGEGTPSYAEKVKEKRKYVGGEQLYEHPMIGMAAGIHFAFQVVFEDLLGEQDEEGNAKMGFYPGVGIYVDYDLAPALGITEFYVSLEGDVLFVGDDLVGNSYNLVHAMIGFKKKWYMTSLVFTVGARFGINYYVVSESDDNVVEIPDLYGVGFDAGLGLEYYIIPEFSIYLKGMFRYFTAPLDEDAEALGFDIAEMGVNASLGVFLAF
jgi:hypothetical protein